MGSRNPAERKTLDKQRKENADLTRMRLNLELEREKTRQMEIAVANDVADAARREGILADDQLERELSTLALSADSEAVRAQCLLGLAKMRGFDKREPAREGQSLPTTVTELAKRIMDAPKPPTWPAQNAGQHLQSMPIPYEEQPTNDACSLNDNLTKMDRAMDGGERETGEGVGSSGAAAAAPDPPA